MESWQDERGITIEIVEKRQGQVGFEVLPRRWVVERTLAILGRARRLRREYEHHDIFSESMVNLSSIGSLLCRLAPSATSANCYWVTPGCSMRLL